MHAYHACISCMRILHAASDAVRTREVFQYRARHVPTCSCSAHAPAKPVLVQATKVHAHPPGHGPLPAGQGLAEVQRARHLVGGKPIGVVLAELFPRILCIHNMYAYMNACIFCIHNMHAYCALIICMHIMNACMHACMHACIICMHA